MDAVIKVEEVEKHETRNGNTRYVVRDEEAHEYVTFRPQIGKDAETYKGQTAHIRFHEEQRGGFKNVYLDAIDQEIEPLEQPGADEGGADMDPDIVGWRTAAEVAPLIAGNADSADEVFDEMKRFKERVAADLRGDQGGDKGGD
jgi:hypothetical protein